MNTIAKEQYLQNILELRKRGMSEKEIASQLGYSAKNGVEELRSNIALIKMEIRLEKASELKRLIAGGKDIYQAAEALGLDYVEARSLALWNQDVVDTAYKLSNKDIQINHKKGN